MHLAPLASAPPARRACLAAGEVVTDMLTGVRYRLTGLIGRGGMGEVFRGYREDTGEPVAVKGIPLERADDRTLLMRTHLEAEALQELRHPNVVRVLAYGVRDDGVVFMVMDLLAGLTVQQIIERLDDLDAAWRVPAALRIAIGVCKGLEAIHVIAVHRDIKPANVMVLHDGRVIVLDLGAGKWNRTSMQLTSTGMQLGTFCFMSPEQLENADRLDGRSDFWSVGVVAYTLIARVHPFAFDGTLPGNQFQLGRRIIHEPHIPLRAHAPTVPSYVAEVIDKMLAKARERRFRSATEAVMVLEATLARFEYDHGKTRGLDALMAALTTSGARRADEHEAAGDRTAINPTESIKRIQPAKRLVSTPEPKPEPEPEIPSARRPTPPRSSGPVVRRSMVRPVNRGAELPRWLLLLCVTSALACIVISAVYLLRPAPSPYQGPIAVPLPPSSSERPAR